MAIRTLLQFRNADLTKDLNDRYVDLFATGVFSGGEVVPVPSQLKVDLLPWKLVSKDGMVAEETSAATRLDTPAGLTTVIAVKAVYLQNNAPIISVEAIELSSFNALPDKDFYIVMAHVVVPLVATQILPTYIDYSPRMIIDQVGRSFLRGFLSTAGALPPQGNRVGDLYIVCDGIGGPVNIHAWTGTQWIIITDVVQLAADLSAHRQNLFTDEKHLLDTEKAAVVGTSGTAVSASNKLIDNADPRIPTINQKEALAGSHGSPSLTNLYITQQFPFALTEEKSSLVVPVLSYVELLSNEGPIFVGRGGVGSANQYFKFYHLTEARELTKVDSTLVLVAGVYTDALLTQEIDPSSNPNVDVQGYFLNATLYVKFSILPDSGYRLLYGRRYLLGTYPQNSFLRRSVNDAQTSAQTVSIIENIKGRSFTTTIPVKEQNINLRKDVVSIKEYLSSVFRADHVIADYTNVETVPDFAGDFVENAGIPQNYSFQNLTLVNYSYAAGTVTFSSPVTLLSVQVGHVFIDGAGTEYRITSVGANTLGITSRDLSVPTSINTTVSSSVSGSAKPDNNPRKINLATFDVICGRERIFVREIEFIENEFHPRTGNIAYQIRSQLVSPFYREPRVRFYGGFYNYLSGTQARVKCTGLGLMSVTGFFTDLECLVDVSSTAPSITVYVDGNPVGTTIDCSYGGRAADYGTSIDHQLKSIRLVSNLADGVPHSVEVEVGNSAGDFVCYGFDLIRRTLSSFLTLPGRAFVQSDLVKSDTVTSSAVTPVIPQGRGSVISRYINRSLSLQSISRPMADFDGTSSTPAGTAVAGSPNFFVVTGLAKLANYKAQDVVLLATAAATEVKVIQSIGPGVGQVVFTDNMSNSGPAILIHLGSTTGVSADPEREYARFYMHQLGLEQSGDFSFLNNVNTDRSFTVEDGSTSVAGKKLYYVTTGIDGIDSAVSFFDASSTFRMRAVCSGIDLLLVNSSPVSMNFSIDGCPTQLKIITGGGLLRVPMLTNARYQSHELSIVNSAGLAIAGFILHEPTLDAGTVDGTSLGTQNILARYISSPTVSGDSLPIGTVAIDPYVSKGVFINGSGLGNPWTYSLDFVNNPAYGRYLSCSQENAYFEFTFIGEAFELEYFGGPDRGLHLVSINGTLANATNFPTVTFLGMNSVTGELDQYAATITRKRFGISGLATGSYTIRVAVQSPQAKNVLSTGFVLNITSIYIANANGLLAVTPNRSYLEKYLYGEDQFRDERNFDSGAVAQQTFPVTRSIISPTRAERVLIPLGATSISITFIQPMQGSNYVITANLLNLVDSTPLYQPITITAQSGSGFTASWNAPIDSVNYYLSYLAVGEY